MATVGFYSPDYTTSYTDTYVETGGIGIANGRAASNGQSYTMITGLSGWMAGRSASRIYHMTLGGTTTAAIGIGSANAAVNTGMQGTNNWVSTGTGASATFRITCNGSFWFGRSTSSGSSSDSYGNSFAGGLAGSYTWAEVPSAPAAKSATAGSADGSIVFVFGAPADDGDAGITEYVVQRATNSAFTANVVNTTVSGGTNTFSGLDIGTTYYFRAGARNGVTSKAGTGSPWSAAKSAVAPGDPSAPRSLTATNSTTAFDTVALSWTVPSDDGGGINGYNIYRNGAQIAKTTTTGTSYTATGLADNTAYTFNVYARNDFSDSKGTLSPASNTASITSNGPPSAPQNLTATANTNVAGEIDLSWQAPATTGAGGITRYIVYFTTGGSAGQTNGSTTSLVVSGLTPGTQYGFYVTAWNAIADSVGQSSAYSNTAYATSQGQPAVPANTSAVASATVPGRLTLTWTEAGGYTGFNVYETTSGTAVKLIDNLQGTTFVIDNLTNAQHTYQIAARNAVTDSSNPPTEGPRTANFAGTPGTTSAINTPATQVTDTTNQMFVGNFTIASLTANTVSYAVAGPDSPSSSVPSGVGSVGNANNSALTGVHTITSTPTTKTFQFVQAVADIPANTAVANGTATDTTNQAFNTTTANPGTVTAVDNTNKTVSYAILGSSPNVASAAATGTISNRSNTVYNGSYVISAIPASNQIQYAKTSADLSETGASGTVTNVSNQTVFNTNGPVTVIATPTYNTFTYAKAGSNRATVAMLTPFGTAYRATSKAVLDVEYRSGWAG